MGSEHVRKRLESNLKLQKMSDVLMKKNDHMARVRWLEKEKEVNTNVGQLLLFLTTFG